MAAITDPMDFVEAAIADAGNDRAKLEQIRRDLDEMRRDLLIAVITVLVEEDERDERERIADYVRFYNQQLLRAHERFIDYLHGRLNT